jgi:hypothetical protein
VSGLREGEGRQQLRGIHTGTCPEGRGHRGGPSHRLRSRQVLRLPEFVCAAAGACCDDDRGETTSRGGKRCGFRLRSLRTFPPLLSSLTHPSLSLSRSLSPSVDSRAGHEYDSPSSLRARLFTPSVLVSAHPLSAHLPCGACALQPLAGNSTRSGSGRSRRRRRTVHPSIDSAASSSSLRTGDQDSRGYVRVHRIHIGGKGSGRMDSW